MPPKNILAILLAALLLFSAPACGENASAIGGGQNAAEDLVSGGTLPQEPAQGEEEAEEPQELEEVPPEEPAEDVRVLDPDKPMVALTFDDGPHPTNTDALLDILEENGAVATFFQVGQNLWRDPDAVRRAEALGCEIGSHSYRHADLSKLSADALAADLKKADDAFIEVLGHAPTLLRPPYGAMNKAVKSTTGRSIITWSMDTEDWLSRNAEKVVAAVQGAGDLNGQVVLMHDIHDSTIEAAKTLVPWLIEQGYQLVTVSELITLHYGDQVLPNGLYGYSYFLYGKPVILPEGQTQEPAPEPEPEEPQPPAQQTPPAEEPAQTPAEAPQQSQDTAPEEPPIPEATEPESPDAESPDLEAPDQFGGLIPDPEASDFPSEAAPGGAAQP